MKHLNPIMNNLDLESIVKANSTSLRACLVHVMNLLRMNLSCLITKDENEICLSSYLVTFWEMRIKKGLFLAFPYLIFSALGMKSCSVLQ